MSDTSVTRATLWRASLDTRAFHFEAFGATRDEAKAALVDGLRIHARQYDLPLDWWRGYADADIRVIVLGLCYLDREPLRASGTDPANGCGSMQDVSALCASWRAL